MAGLEQMDENEVSFMILVVDSWVMGIVVLVHLNVVCEHGFFSEYVWGFFFQSRQSCHIIENSLYFSFSIISSASSPCSFLPSIPCITVLTGLSPNVLHANPPEHGLFS